MQQTKKNPFWRKNLLWILLAFLLPGILELIFLMVQGYAPFGNKSLAVMDADIQYLDFFRYLRQVLRGEDSLLYSFSIFLGDSGIGIFAYYLASPLNFLILLFKDGQEHAFFSLLVLLKLSLGGLTSYLFISKRFPQLPVVFGLSLSCCYALMHYSVFQSSNIMWLDGVYMLPLLLLGVWQMMQGKKMLLYTLALTASILFNWYSAFFNCCTIVIYLLFEMFFFSKEIGPLRGNLLLILKTGACSLLSVALSAVLFYPNILALLRGKGLGSWVVRNQFNGNLLSIFSGLSIGSGSDRGFPAFFCGSLVFLGVVLFFVLKGHSLKYKIKNGVFLLLLALLFYYYPLEFLMNGMREVFSYFYRYAYIVVPFFMIYAADALIRLKTAEKPLAPLTAAAAFTAGALLLDQYITGAAGRLFSVYATIAFLLLLAALLYRWRCRGFANSRCAAAFGIFLMGASCLELLINNVKVNQHLLNGYTLCADVSAYPEYVAEQTAQIAALKAADSSFYRISQTTPRYMGTDGRTAFYNEPMSYGYHGITHYSSTNDILAAQMMIRLGYSTVMELPVNNTRLLSSDAMLGVKYILSEQPIAGLQKLESMPQSNGKSVYLNPFALSSALIYNEGEKAVYDGNPFEYQNRLFSELCGKNVAVFKPVEPERVKESDNVYYTMPNAGSRQILYGCIETSEYLYAKLYADEQFLCEYSYWLTNRAFTVPTGTEELVTVRLANVWDENIIQEEWFYYLDLDVLEEISSMLNSRAAACNIQNGRVSCRVSGRAGEQLLLQVPYSEGWSIRLNGKELTEVGRFADCLVSIPLEEGENTVEMVYHVPGLKAGAVCTLLAALGLALYGAFLLYQKRRKK